MQQDIYGWFFSKLSIKRITLEVDSSVLTRWGKQQQGARVGYPPAQPWARLAPSVDRLRGRLPHDRQLLAASRRLRQRGRADGENRIKELKADFGLDSFNLRDFWATEAALTMAILAYNLMSLFRQSVMRASVQSRLNRYALFIKIKPRSHPQATDYESSSPTSFSLKGLIICTPSTSCSC